MSLATARTDTLHTRRPPWGQPAVVAISLIGLVFLGYFRRFSEFGLYGDDAAFLGGAINASWHAEWEYVWFCLTRWPQGRPLGNAINISLAPYLVFHLGGLPALHLAAFGIVAANTLMMYRFVLRVATPLAAFVAAGFYGLAPADTVQISLVWGFNSEVAVLVALFAAHFALSRQWLLYAIAVAAVLAMAEPAAMFALVAPLGLTFHPRRPDWGRALSHAGIWVAVGVLVLLIRKDIGDPWGTERVTELAAHPAQTLLRSAQSATTGPVTHLSLVVARLALPLRELDQTLTAMMAATACLGLTGIAALPRHRPLAVVEDTDGNRSVRPILPALRAPVHMILVGLLTMIAIYATFFRIPWHPANWQTGFMSGVHLVAASGSALVFGGLTWLVETCCTRGWRLVWALVAATFLALLGGFGQLVQNDYVDAWHFQRHFWRAYVTLCPDAGPGTYILVLDRDLPSFRFIERTSWTAEILPNRLFSPSPATPPHNYSFFGSSRPRPTRDGNAAQDPNPRLQHPPSVIFTAPEAAQAIGVQDGRPYWKPTYYFMLPKTDYEQPEDGHVIALERRKGEWMRLEGELAIDGGTLHLQPPRGDTAPTPSPRLPLAHVFGL